MYFRCPVCFKSDTLFPSIEIEYNNKREFELDCPNGHKLTCYYQGFIYPISFHEGLIYYKKGEYFSSFLSIFSAYEQFMDEFVENAFIHQCEKHGVDIDYEAFKKNCKDRLLRDSNRKVAAYEMAYLSIFGDFAPSISKSLTEIRNKIVHKGFIPQKHNVENLLESVWVMCKNVFLKMEDDLMMMSTKNSSLEYCKWLTDNHLDHEKMMNNEKFNLFVSESRDFELGFGTIYDVEFDLEKIMKQAECIENTTCFYS